MMNEEASLVSAATGLRVGLSSLWATRRVVCVFLRHLRCALCKHQASKLTALAPALRASGVTLVVACLGATAAEAAAFAEEFGLGSGVAEMYTDPDHAAASAYVCA